MKLNILKIDHVQICIPKGQEPIAKTFYGDLLGLLEIDKPAALKPNGGMWYQVGDLQLHIGTETVDQGASKRHVAFEVSDLETAKLVLERRSILIKQDTPIPGVKRFSIRDPFGNRIELLEKI